MHISCNGEMTVPIFWCIFVFLCGVPSFCTGVTMKQFDASLDMLRSVCAPKFKIPTEKLDNLRKGIFEEDPELKCYTRCIAQMTGTLGKKGEISLQKGLVQVNVILPTEIQDVARKALESCVKIQDNFKESCDKCFYLTKCIYEYSPENFKFP